MTSQGPGPKRSLRYLALCFLLLGTLGACSKSVEGESKRWERANRTVDELGVLYPSLKAALEEQRGKAKAAMEAAKAIGNEEERINKMATANTLLDSGFVGELAAVDAVVKRIREKSIDVAAQADPALQQGAKQASAAAERVITEAQAMLRRGVANADEAGIVLRKVTSDLRQAESNLDRMARAAREKKQAEQKAAQGSGQGAGVKAGEGAGTQAQGTWTCEYCDTANSAEAQTCSNCGAARPTGK